MKVFCCHGDQSTIWLFNSVFRTSSDASSKLYFVEMGSVSEKLWLLGSVYTGPDPFRTDTKLARISLAFTRDLMDPVRIGSAIWYQMGPLMKVILCGTVPF